MNIGLPLTVSATSGCMTSQCSTRRPSLTRKMFTATIISGVSRLCREWTMTMSPSATTLPISYLTVGPIISTKPFSMSVPFGICA